MALSAIALAALLTGCGRDPTPTPTEEPPPKETAQEILVRASNQLQDLESASFSLDQLTGVTQLFPGLEMTKASGMVDIPDKAQLKIEAELVAPRSYIEMEIITIGEDAYMTDFLSGQWTQVPQNILPFRLDNLGVTLATIVSKVQTPELAGVELLDGVETYRISGTVKSQDLSGIVPGAGTDFDVGLELWLDWPHALLRQAMITGKVVPSDIPEAVRRLTLDDINLPVDIKPPG